MYRSDHDSAPPPPLQPQTGLFDEWLEAKGEGVWCEDCKHLVRADECMHRKPLRPTVLSAIESPRRRRYLSEGLYYAERNRTRSPPSVHTDPLLTLMEASRQPAAQAEADETLDTTISRIPTPYLDVPRTPPRSNRNLSAIHGKKFVLIDVRALTKTSEELDFNVFDGNKVISREAGKPVPESTPTEKRPGSPTSPETPRRSKRLQAPKDSKEPPRTPSRIGLVHVDQNMASPVSPKKRGPRTSAKENGKVRPVSSSPRKRRSFGKATRMEEYLLNSGEIPQ